VSPPSDWGQGGGGEGGGGGGGFGQPPGGGGGGGFGQPPGGGGGGGFGQPPGSAGGGGFGQPAGGGGGFGQPPGGGTPPPGGGGYGGGGGEGPLGRIPFSPEDEKNITQTALFMKIAGGLAIAGSLFSITGSIGVGLYRGSPIGVNLCFGVVGLGIQALLALLLFMSASAFEKIVSSDGNDQQHLAAGLKQLRVYFMVKAVLWVIGFLLCCACLALGMVFGAAIMAAIGGAMGQ
jgi:hypothetical protein